VRPIARLDVELRASALLALSIAAAGLFGAFGRGADPARAIVGFAVAAILIGIVSHVGTRFLRTGERFPRAADGVLIEHPAQTMRRTIVGMVLPMLVVIVLLAVSGGTGAVFGGVLAGIGIIDLANLAVLRRRQAAGREVVFRELGGSPFAGGRRPIYTRPT
jgi:hypothetical protein